MLFLSGADISTKSSRFIYMHTASSRIKELIIFSNGSSTDAKQYRERKLM